LIRKVLVYVSLVVLALNGVRDLIYMGVLKNKNGVFEKYNTMFLKENNYNVLFLGSSRAEMHFDPNIFDSLTGKNSYNLGVTGATPRIAYKVLKAYCSKSKMPEYLVFDTDPHFLKYGVDTIRHFPRYFPFLDNDVLLKEFAQIDDRFLQFKYNPFYSLPYSNIGMISVALHGWLGIPGKYDTCYYKGFAGTVLDQELEEYPDKKFYSYFHLKERAYLDSIIYFSKAHNIRLILTTSPMYSGSRAEFCNKTQILSQFRNIAIINSLEYHDFSDFSLSNDPKTFVDYYHMNASGAKVFTGQFSAFFSQYFDKKVVN
jgi:hypothetical protein